MLKKITFEKKLGIDSSEKKWRGLKVATISCLLAFSGVLFIALGATSLGKAIVFLGILGGFVGMAMHLVAMLEQFGKSENK